MLNTMCLFLYNLLFNQLKHAKPKHSKESVFVLRAIQTQKFGVLTKAYKEKVSFQLVRVKNYQVFRRRSSKSGIMVFVKK